jgi:WD40 repeat protein
VARVFVSHSSQDAARAAEIHGWLVAAEHDAFLDRDLVDGIVGGDEWEQRLHERLRAADAVVCVVTAAYVGSPWCAAEVAVARSRGAKLIPVLGEPGVTHPLLGSVQYVPWEGDVRERVVAALRQVDLAGGAGWPDDRSPFPGLRAFGTDQHRVFFGRRAEVTELTGLLRSPAGRADAAVLLVVGPSGCGKSSLIRAGLLPAVAAEPGWWTLSPMLPGTDPVSALERELAATGRALGVDWTLDDVRRRLAGDGLVAVVGELLHAAPPPRRTRLLLTVDQFEELLTQSGAAERAAFAELVRPALGGPVQVVATLRPEFLDQLLVSPELAGLATRTFTVRPLLRDALPAVVEGPCRLAGIGVDEGLVARLVTDTAGGEALPLLAYTLAQLADGVSRGGRLSLSRYEQLGGVRGTLTRQADAALADAVAAGGRTREQVLHGLLRLVTVDEQGRPTRWRVPAADLPAAELEPFVERRLLSTDRAAGEAVVEVAHEAILSEWPPLAAAVQANSTALRARRGIEQAAAEWAGQNRPAARLWEGGQLAAALTETGVVLGRRRVRRGAPPPERVGLSVGAREFLQAGVRRDRRRRARTTAVLSVLLVAALVAAVLASVQLRAADQGRRLATARLLAGQAAASIGSDPRTALRLAEAALHLRPGVETRSALAQLVRDTRYTGTLEGHTESVSALAYAPDGRTLATASWDHSVLLWDLTGPRPQRTGPPLRHDSTVTALAFAPDGRTLFTGTTSADEPPAPAVVVRWDLGDPNQPVPVGDPAPGIEFGPDAMRVTGDGRVLVVADETELTLWDLTDPVQLRPLTSRQDLRSSSVATAQLSPDGRRLAVASYDGIQLWDLADPTRPERSGAPLAQGRAHGAEVNALAFSPDGRLLAGADLDDSSNSRLVLWDLATPGGPQPIGTPLVLTGPVWRGLAFSVDGRRLAIGTADATVEVWDLAYPAHPARVGAPLTGHGSDVVAVAFAPDGHTVVSGSDDDTALLWDLTDPFRARPVADLPGTATAVSAGGRLLAGAGAPDLMAMLWDVTDPAHPRTLSRFAAGPDLPPGDYRFSSVALAPDGGLLASYTGDLNNGTVSLWDVHDPTRPRALARLPLLRGGSIHRMVFAPQQPLLAVAAPDGVLLFDVTDPYQPAPAGTVPTGDFLSAVEFDPSGRTLLSSGPSASGLIRWDLGAPDGPRPLGPALALPQSFGVAATFAPDGRTVATASDDGGVALWAPDESGRLQQVGQPLRGPGQSMMLSAAYTPDGRTLATGGPGEVLLWDLTDPARPRPLGGSFHGHGNTTGSMRFVDGRTLAAVDPSNTRTQLWDVSALLDERENPLPAACLRTGGGLDRAEWDRFVPDLDYEDSCADVG